MITCHIEIQQDIDALHKISKRTECKIEKKKDVLLIHIHSKDIVSAKAFTNSILNIIEIYYKV